MPPKQKRPDAPTEVARRARSTAVELMEVTLDYLENPTGLDEGSTWPGYVERAQRVLEDLRALDIPVPVAATVPEWALEVLRRAAKVAQDVMTMTRIDEDTVKISDQLLRLQSETNAAAKAPPG